MHGAILPLPQYVFMAWSVVKRRDKFTFTFTKVTGCDGVDWMHVVQGSVSLHATAV
jgi:hypothetical protein